MSKEGKRKIGGDQDYVFMFTAREMVKIIMELPKDSESIMELIFQGHIDEKGGTP